jgi:hypothetical protein
LPSAAVRSLIGYIGQDIDALSAFPAAQGVADDARVTEQRAAEIRQQFDKLDPLEIRARLLSAAASGKDESIRAVLNADAEAFPKLAMSLDSDTKRAIGLELRYHGNAAGRQTVDDLIALKDSLTAAADDLARASDLAGDPIARMATSR